MLLDVIRSQLLVVDVQERLLAALPDAPALVEACDRLLAAASTLGVPTRLTEQYVRGLGVTPERLRARAPSSCTFEKQSFSCLGHAELARLLQDRSRPQIVICGAEAHVCVLQTAIELRTGGQDVFVVADAVASREAPVAALALDRLRACGVQVVSVEMVLFEWLRVSATPEFRAVAPLVRRLVTDVCQAAGPPAAA